MGRVVVAGAKSIEMFLRNMVFQGTVWGPILWNVFCEDARWALEQKGFFGLVFADDINGYKMYRGKEDVTLLVGCRQPG